MSLGRYLAEAADASDRPYSVFRSLAMRTRQVVGDEGGGDVHGGEVLCAGLTTRRGFVTADRMGRGKGYKSVLNLPSICRIGVVSGAA